MKKAGFTLVEVTVVLLIFTMILNVVVKLVLVATERFGKQEEAIIFATQAATVISKLRKDLQRCQVNSPDANRFAQVSKAVSFKQDVLNFNILDGTTIKPITYVFDKTTRALIRNFNGENLTIGKGMIEDFFVTFQVFTGESGYGNTQSFPFDPEVSTPSPPAPPPETRVLRTWLKVMLELKSTKKVDKPVHQKYVFRVFPIHMNRQIQSLWVIKP